MTGTSKRYICSEMSCMFHPICSVYTGHLESGKSMSIEYKTFAVSEHALNPVLGSLTVNTNRAFTKLDGIIASFSRADNIEELTVEEVPPQHVIPPQCESESIFDFKAASGLKPEHPPNF